MNRWVVTLACILVSTLVAGLAIAQPPDREGERRGPGQGPRGGPRFEGERDFGPGPGRGFRPPLHPLMKALDADADGELSAEEIKNATAALKEIDANGDGKLSGDELRPQFGGPGGPGREAPGGGLRRGPGEDRPGGPGRFRGPGAEERGGGGGPGGRGPGGGRPGGPGGGNIVDRIMGFDSNEDGKVSKDELPQPMQRMLERVDTNKDGAIDREEAEAVAERFRAGRGGPERGGRPEGGPGGPRRPQRPE